MDHYPITKLPVTKVSPPYPLSKSKAEFLSMQQVHCPDTGLRSKCAAKHIPFFFLAYAPTVASVASLLQFSSSCNLIITNTQQDIRHKSSPLLCAFQQTHCVYSLNHQDGSVNSGCKRGPCRSYYFPIQSLNTFVKMAKFTTPHLHAMRSQTS